MILNPTPAELVEITAESRKHIYQETLERLTPDIELIIKDMYVAANQGEYHLTVNFEDASFGDQEFVIDYFHTLGFKVCHHCDRRYNIKW